MPSSTFLHRVVRSVLPLFLIQGWREDAGPGVYLTVSSLVSKDVQRQLEVNWHNVSPDLGPVTVALFDRDPTQDSSSPLDQAPVGSTPNGFFRTKVQFPRPAFNASALKSSCLGYWGALLQGDRVVASSCIKYHPRWMEELKDTIKNKALRDLLIPGTHNAGSYKFYTRSSYSLLTKYQICQEENIWSQLAYGIRFFDIRVSYQTVRGSGEKFWVSHDMFRMDTSIREVLNDIKRFLDETQEIVILDFHRFNNGFSKSKKKQVHKLLMELVEEVLGDYMIPSTMGDYARLEELWSSNKRVYVGYADQERYGNNKFNNPVRHLWAEADKEDQLMDFLRGRVCSGYYGGLTAAMAELTPKVIGVIFNRYGGLRVMADKVNRPLSRLYREELARCGHIVATDFFLGNNLIDIAVDYNRKL